MRVDIYRLSGQGDDEVAGVLHLDGGKITAEPPDSRLLLGILADPVHDSETQKVYDATTTPAAWLHALHQQYKSAYLRASKVIEDDSDSGSGERVEKSWLDRNDKGDAGDEDGHDGALAQHYASLWNTMQAHGETIAHPDLHAASEELTGTPWRVTCLPDRSWVAHRWDDVASLRGRRHLWLKGHEPVVTKEAEHAPRGGIFLVNMKGESRFYVGGQWIPAKEIANLPPAEKAKLEQAKNQGVQQNRVARVQRGDVNAEQLRAQLRPHNRVLTDDEQKRARQELRALHGYHGDLTLHRIEELAQQQQGFLRRKNLTEKQRQQIRGNLARLSAMIGAAQKLGVSGKVPQETQDKAGMSPAWDKARQRLMERQEGGEAGLLRGSKKPERPQPKEPEAAEAAPARSNSPITPEQAAQALAKQAGHVAQPKEGEDAASEFNRQLIEEGKEKQKPKEEAKQPAEQPAEPKREEEKPAEPQQQSPEDTAFHDAWDKVLADDPVASQMVNGAKLPNGQYDERMLDAARERVLTQMLRDGTPIPESVQQKYAKMFEKAVDKLAAERDSLHSTVAELTSPEARWERALSRNPEAKELLASKNPKKRINGLVRLMRQGLVVPESVQADNPDAYRAADKRISAGRYQSDLHRSGKNEREDWTDRAFEAGIRPKDLHAQADEILRQDTAHRKRRQELLHRAVELYAKLTGYNARALTTNLRSGRVKDEPPGTDVVRAALSREFPEEFGGIEYERGANERSGGERFTGRGYKQIGTEGQYNMMDLFKEGVPPKMSKNEAYEKAFEEISHYLEQHEDPGEQTRDREPGEDDDEEETSDPADTSIDDDDENDFPFGYNAKALRAWLRKSRRRRKDVPGQQHLFDPDRHPRGQPGNAGEFAPKEGGVVVSKPEEESAQREREYSDQDKSTREQGRVFNEVMADPEAASTRDLTIARGYADLLAYHNKRRFRRGEIDQEQLDAANDSLRVEADNLDRILRDRINGRAAGPEDMTRAEKIAEKAIQENRPAQTIAKEMGLTLDEYRDMRDEVARHIEDFRKLQKDEASSSRQRAQERAKQVQAREATIDAALARHTSHNPTTGGGLFGDMEARRGFAKLPHGTPIVFTEGEFAGRTGKIVRDVDTATGTPRIVAEVDGREGLVPISPEAIEPLAEHLSWRVGGGGSGAGTEQGGLFTADQFLPKREGRQESSSGHTETAPDTATANSGHKEAVSDEQAVSKLVKQAVGTQTMTQARARNIEGGGEIGPNGEHYRAGAFIATTDMPKRIKQKIERSAQGKVQVDFGYGHKWEVPKPGEMSILDKIGGTVLNPRDGSITYGYLDYIKATSEEREMYERLADKWRKGERWVSVSEFPQLANIKDAARLVVAGQPVPAEVLDKFPEEWRKYLTKYKPKEETR